MGVEVGVAEGWKDWGAGEGGRRRGNEDSPKGCDVGRFSSFVMEAS